MAGSACLDEQHWFVTLACLLARTFATLLHLRILRQRVYMSEQQHAWGALCRLREPGPHRPLRLRVIVTEEVVTIDLEEYIINISLPSIAVHHRKKKSAAHLHQMHAHPLCDPADRRLLAAAPRALQQDR